jgi:hypothetical protein
MFPLPRFAAKLIYLALLSVLGFYCMQRPLYNWDLLPYTDLVLRMDGQPATQAHDQSYRLAENNIPPASFRLLTDSMNAYRFSLYRQQPQFDAQLPFYAVKPLYIILSFVAFKCGVALPLALLVPGIFSLMLFGWLVFQWLSRYLSPTLTLFMSLLFMFCSPVVEVGKLFTPDCLSTCFLAFAFYYVLEKPSWAAALVAMVLATWTRLDNVIACGALLILLRRNTRNQIDRRDGTSILSLAVLIVSYFAITAYAAKYGWGVFYYNQFAHRLHPHYGEPASFSWRSYLRLMYEHASSAINHSYLAVFLIMLFPVFQRIKGVSKLSADQRAGTAILLILVARFLLYPDISDRFYVAFYLVCVVLLLRRLTSLRVADPG